MTGAEVNRMGKQSGAVLLVSLVLLLIMTIIGMSALNVTTLDTRVLANSKDRQMAFDAAETALNQGSESIGLDKPLPSASTEGFMSTDLADNWWHGLNGAWWGENSAQISDFDGLHSNSSGIGYVIEQPIEIRTNGAGQRVADVTLGEPRPVTRFYRITSRGEGPGGADVLLQTIYARKVYLNTAE